MEQESADDRRKFQRISTVMKIRAVPLKDEDADAIESSGNIPTMDDIEADEGVIYSESLDFSEGGLKATGSVEPGAAVPKEGSRYLVEFEMPPPNGTRAAILARLMWASEGDDGQSVVGLRFDIASTEDMKRIRDFIDSVRLTVQMAGQAKE